MKWNVKYVETRFERGDNQSSIPYQVRSKLLKVHAPNKAKAELIAATNMGYRGTLLQHDAIGRAFWFTEDGHRHKLIRLKENK
jgi:hypothetical protein